eukprot:CAMPEP_0174924004 /NCGR_PEP_ID=MMETSP1355-20121228/6959_1 /TAXON_ID=464990 /ORGANISM="Hemiselmis tepida, Strain CCMP443" /LENGTH=49 /DNA_ID=CAMNT_0016169747 /DNA_START=122 /DNA_END=271 /DNA_ORIENTATION=+
MNLQALAHQALPVCPPFVPLGGWLLSIEAAVDGGSGPHVYLIASFLDTK